MYNNKNSSNTRGNSTRVEMIINLRRMILSLTTVKFLNSRENSRKRKNKEFFKAPARNIPLFFFTIQLSKFIIEPLYFLKSA